MGLSFCITKNQLQKPDPEAAALKLRYKRSDFLFIDKRVFYTGIFLFILITILIPAVTDAIYIFWFRWCRKKKGTCNNWKCARALTCPLNFRYLGPEKPKQTEQKK